MNQPPPLPADATTPQKTSGLALASLIFGIISLVGGALLIIPVLLAIILGHIACARCNRDSSIGGRGLAIAGLVTGYVSILGIGLMAAMAIPAFQKVRENALQKTMANNARLLAAAAAQVRMENGSKPVSFSIDPATGKVSGPLSAYVSEVTRGTTAVDNTFENDADGFSLRHPQTYGGAAIRFDVDGRPVNDR